MLLIPSIDILDGKCVRLLRGDYDQSTEYSGNPAEIAREFQNLGATRIHVVDLDAARGQGRNNRRAIRRIRDSVECMIEVGGGVRAVSDIDDLLEIGVERLAVGTVLAREPETVQGWVASYGAVFVAAIDARDGEVKVAGWEEGSGIRDVVLAERARDIGVVSIVYTSISRDGTLEGPDIEGTCRIADAAGIPVVLSGGVSDVADLVALAEADCAGVVGAISGRAIYEGRLDPAAVFERFPAGDTDINGW